MMFILAVFDTLHLRPSDWKLTTCCTAAFILEPFEHTSAWVQVERHVPLLPIAPSAEHACDATALFPQPTFQRHIFWLPRPTGAHNTTRQCDLALLAFEFFFSSGWLKQCNERVAQRL